jgi:hypothetical protein
MFPPLSRTFQWSLSHSESYITWPCMIWLSPVPFLCLQSSPTGPTTPSPTSGPLQRLSPLARISLPLNVHMAQCLPSFKHMHKCHLPGETISFPKLHPHPHPPLPYFPPEQLSPSDIPCNLLIYCVRCLRCQLHRAGFLSAVFTSVSPAPRTGSSTEESSEWREIGSPNTLTTWLRS